MASIFQVLFVVSQGKNTLQEINLSSVFFLYPGKTLRHRKLEQIFD